MAPINWVQFSERVVGENSSLYTDVTNRPLKEVVLASGLSDINSDFPGFALEYEGAGTPESFIISNPGALYFQQDSPFALWIKQTGVGAAGWAIIGGASISGTPEFVAKFNAAGANVEDSIMWQTLIGSPAIIVGSDPSPGAGEILRTANGFVSQGAGAGSTVIGIGALSAGASAIAIGEFADATGSTSIAIGFGANSLGADSIAIGGSTLLGAGQYTIGIGRSVTTGATLGAIAVGYGSTSIGSRTTVVGPQAIASAAAASAIAIGDQASAAATNNIVIGTLASVPATFTGAIAIGGSVTVRAINAIAIGQGATIAAVGPTVNDSVCIGAGSFIQGGNVASTALTANVLIGPRNSITSNQTGGFQPVDNFIVIGNRNLLTNTLGGTYQNVVAIGAGITGNALSDAVVIGYPAVAFPTQFSGIAIGPGIQVNVGDFLTIIGQNARNAGGNDNIIIGRGAFKQGVSGQENILIGTLAVINNIDACVVIGSQAQAGGVATGAIAIGRLANVQFANCVAIGNGATPNATNQCVIGSDFIGSDYRTFIFGQGPFRSSGGGAVDTRWRSSDASGLNFVLGNLIIQAGLPTGNAVSGDLILQTGTLGASGSTLQAAAARITAMGGKAGTQVFIGGDPGGTETFRVGGSFAINDPTQLVSNKQAFTNNAAAAVGTLNNAPAVGDPTKWIRIDDNGTPRFIPAW